MDYVFEKRIGTERIMGTDHPVMAVVYKTGERSWVGAIICNGIAQESTTFGVKQHAIEWANHSRRGSFQAG